jgi:dephospho-CoA kinase
MSRHPFIGITGSMGSGKSTVLKLLRERGQCVFSADALIKETIYPQHLEELKARFPSCVTAGGMDPVLLGRHIYSDAAAYDWLARFVNDRLRPLLGHLRETASQTTLVEVPFLFEHGYGDLFDGIVFISTNDALRKVRLEGRGLNPESIRRREAHHLKPEEKLLRSRWVVYNNGGLEELGAELDVLLLSIRTLPQVLP